MRISDWSSDVCSSDLAMLPRFTGEIMQVPPAFSAIKVDGERAYNLARAGEAVELKARAVNIHNAKLLGMPDGAHAELEISSSEERRVWTEGVSTCNSRGAPYK